MTLRMSASTRAFARTRDHFDWALFLAAALLAWGGLDLAHHAESAYSLGGGGGRISG